jgi:hypothetical protein
MDRSVWSDALVSSPQHLKPPMPPLTMHPAGLEDPLGPDGCPQLPGGSEGAARLAEDPLQ